ncbi:SMR family transporter [Bifidobacterium sp. SO4]|uniref:DMT family transporter n=1 Tax=Bifidobacterium sp. SO4 TaxID=2809030 RepID=UPI001BDC9286|nr:SMR family transporter [Bifidobacterium sp. SO4]
MTVMPWFVLVISGICESVWAIALDRSKGFSRLIPTVVFVIGLVASMGGLSYAMKHIPIGTSYAIWVGIGAAITAVYGMLSGEDAVSLIRILLIIGLVACVIGLKLID